MKSYKNYQADFHKKMKNIENTGVYQVLIE